MSEPPLRNPLEVTCFGLGSIGFGCEGIMGAGWGYF